ncbi:hypothetical protein [Caldicellulosiruptor obsidiansis]|uniref:hypothetical protein n=1 Tax=Caldicellulosiruptor obsidiansis TaxID=717609 RepID=UPI001ED96C76|nr:hypothetical protein [Caldicellulosiruptor obsidiansis]
MNKRILNCGRKIEPKENNLDFCSFCESFVDLGDELMKSLFIIDSWGKEKGFLGFSDIYNVIKAFGRYEVFASQELLDMFCQMVYVK